MALSRLLQVSIFEDSRRHRLLRAFIYVFMSFTLLHFHIVLWHLFVTFPWTYVFKLCFDNGCVHNLLVGSEPTHCIYILLLCIYRLQTLLYYPLVEWNLYFVYYWLFVSSFWRVDVFMIILLLLFYCFLIAGRCSRVCLLLFGGLVFADTRKHKRIGHAKILNFRT